MSFVKKSKGESDLYTSFGLFWTIIPLSLCLPLLAASSVAAQERFRSSSYKGMSSANGCLAMHGYEGMVEHVKFSHWIHLAPPVNLRNLFCSNSSQNNQKTLNSIWV